MTGHPAAGGALQTSGLGRRYGRRTWALRDCTLELPEGRMIGLVGANGAGKTTLLHLIIGLLKPTEGSVTRFGRPVGTPPAAGWTGWASPWVGGPGGSPAASRPR